MTTRPKTPKSKRWIIATIALASVVAYCAPPGTFRGIDFDYTGTIRDKDTNEPIEGAYVVGMYSVSKSNMAASVFQCKKTVGTYSDRNGVYHLPLEKLDGLNPSEVAFIKPGYFGDEQVFPKGNLRFAKTKERFSNRDVFLRKQNPAKPEFDYGVHEISCIFAETHEVVEASIKFYSIKLGELERLNADSRWLSNAKEEIARLKALPTTK